MTPMKVKVKITYLLHGMISDSLGVYKLNLFVIVFISLDFMDTPTARMDVVLSLIVLHLF